MFRTIFACFSRIALGLLAGMQELRGIVLAHCNVPNLYSVVFYSGTLFMRTP
jgi:hypothetical protein